MVDLQRRAMWIAVLAAVLTAVSLAANWQTLLGLWKDLADLHKR
jgi:hypothetical protein